jgi:16S rRNA (uracil1498-N3)-methyltransferase
VTRVLIRPDGIIGDRVTFDAEETRHLTRVLRLGHGDIVEAFDGLGNVLTVRLQRVGGRFAEGALLARAALRSESPLHLTGAEHSQGRQDGGHIRMATGSGYQCGAVQDGPGTVARRPERGPASRLAASRKEAAKQTGRAVITEVTAPTRLVP